MAQIPTPVVANIGSCTYRQVPISRLGHLLRAKLPNNVLLLDGQCTLSVGHMSYCIERNYSFSATDEAKNNDMLLKNTIFFGSFNMPDSKELTRNALSLLGHASKFEKRDQKKDADSLRKSSSSQIPPLSPNAASDPFASISGGAVAHIPSFFLFIEKVPSKALSAKAKRHGGMEEKMFTRADGSVDAKEAMDLLITTGGYAMIRLMTHLDRGYLRAIGHVLWRCCPHALVRLWTVRQEKLKYFHGRQAADLFKTPTAQRGLQERLWSAQGVGLGKVKKPIDMSKIFETQ